MKNRASNKILAFALAVALLVTLLPGGISAPVTAKAAPALGNIFYVGTAGQWVGQESSKVYSNPQEAINAAASWSADNSNASAYVLVAVGTYTTTSDNSNTPFSLANNVTVIGGFTGTENGIIPTYAQDGDANKATNTVFSGSNATSVFNHNNNGLTSAAVLENVVIANGNANDGGGMYNNGCSPTLTNCTFSNNKAKYGGGMCNETSSNPILAICTFTGNTADFGGGMYGDSGSTLTNCTFTGNTASYDGGGMFNTGGSPMLTNCTFTDNTANTSGGGMSNISGSAPTLTNCTFTGNVARYGGGMEGSGKSNPALTNCTFTGNIANQGGGIYSAGSNPVLTNCIVTLNTADSGADIQLASYNPGNPVYKASIIGASKYDASGNETQNACSPDADHFNSDGSLKDGADYAIKEGHYDSYTTAITAVLATLNGKYGTSLTAADMRDINGNLFVSGTTNNETIDIGAFRFIASGETGGTIELPNLPTPIVSAVSGGADYASGALANGDVTITTSKGNVAQWIKDSGYYPFFPKSYLDDFNTNASLYYKLDDGNETLYTPPLTVSTTGTYELYSKWNGKESAHVTFTVNIDKIKPTIASVSPSGTGEAISGDIEIKFSESMKTTSGVGAVSLSGGAATLNASGAWSTDTNTNDTYTIGYSGLDYDTAYTVGISDFQDAARNVMDEDDTKSFTTLSNPYRLAWEGDTGPVGGFADLIFGYSAGSSVTYTIKSTGSQTVTNISASITEGSNNYQITTSPAASLVPGGTTTVTVKSEIGLNASATPYTGALTVTWTNGGAGITQSLSQLVNKAPRTISAPTQDAVTHNSVTLNAVTPSAGNGDDTVEYAYNTENAAPAIGWQTGVIISNLSASTTYYFFARVTGGTDYEDAASTGTQITTSAAPVKTIDVGAQTGTLTAGTAGSVTFAVTTTNITSGSSITLNANNIAGVALDASAVVTTDNATVIAINTTAETPAGNHPLTLTIDGATSGGFYLIVNSAVISEAAITGVTAPAYGETPVTAITDSSQYTGTVSWSPAHDTFQAGSVYTAIITLTAKQGYTLTGVAANFFTVAGASNVSNSADSSVITAVFPQTGPAPDTVIASAAVAVTAPATGNAPVTSAPTGGTGYTCSTVVWSPTGATFQGGTRYTATVTLTASSGYTFTGGLTTATINGQTATVTNNTGAAATLTYMFAATHTPSDSGSPYNDGLSGGSSTPQTSAYRNITIKDQNGRTIGSFDSTGSISGGTMLIKPSAKSDVYVFGLNLLRLSELENANKGGKFRIMLPGIEYELPFNMANIVTGLADFLGDTNLKDYTLDFTIKKLTGDDITKEQEAFKKAYPNGVILGDFYDISFALYRNGSKVDFNANQFDSAVTFSLTTVKKCNAILKYDAKTGRFIFVPAKFTDTKATAQTKTHSVYVAARNSVTFPDVKAGAWYEPFVIGAANKGLVEGYAGRFRPDAEVTRAEFVQMIVNAIQLPAAKSDTKEYGDVTNKNVWYYGAIMKARFAGLLGGFTDVDFKPNQSITREEMASVLAAVLRRNNIPTTEQMIYLDQIYIDYAEMDKKYLAYIELVYRVKLMQGVGDGKYDPKGVTTRAQAATVQIRLLEILGMIDINDKK